MSYSLFYAKSVGDTVEGPEIAGDFQWQDFCELVIELDEYPEIELLTEDGRYDIPGGDAGAVEQELTLLARDPETDLPQAKIAERLLRHIRNRPPGTIAISVECAGEEADEDDEDSWVVTDEDADNWSRDQRHGED